MRGSNTFATDSTRHKRVKIRFERKLTLCLHSFSDAAWDTRAAYYSLARRGRPPGPAAASLGRRRMAAGWSCSPGRRPPTRTSRRTRARRPRSRRPPRCPPTTPPSWTPTTEPGEHTRRWRRRRSCGCGCRPQVHPQVHPLARPRSLRRRRRPPRPRCRGPRCRGARCPRGSSTRRSKSRTWTAIASRTATIAAQRVPDMLVPCLANAHPSTKPSYLYCLGYVSHTKMHG